VKLLYFYNVVKASCSLYVLLTVHLGMILVNNQLDAHLTNLHTRRSSTQSDINQVSH